MPRTPNTASKLNSDGGAGAVGVGNGPLVVGHTGVDALRLVVGCWTDQRFSTYEVQLDGASGTTCTVRTSRPSGERLSTKALIHLGGPRDSNVIWGRNNYKLDVESASPAQICWLPLKGGNKTFVWNSTTEQAQPTGTTHAATLHSKAPARAFRRQGFGRSIVAG